MDRPYGLDQLNYYRLEPYISIISTLSLREGDWSTVQMYILHLELSKKNDGHIVRRLAYPIPSLSCYLNLSGAQD